MKKVLVAYGSKYGATAEIATRIGQALRERGLEVSVLSVERQPDPGQFDAVVLGSAVYAGQWRKDAAGFLKAQAAALVGRPVWLFSSGPTGAGDPMALTKGWRLPQGLQPLAVAIGPRDVALFQGAMDPDRLSLPERLLVRAIKAPLGDFRDWSAIEAWAGQIAAALDGQPQ